MNNYYSYDSYDSPRELVPGEVDVGEERELGVEGGLRVHRGRDLARLGLERREALVHL